MWSDVGLALLHDGLRDHIETQITILRHAPEELKSWVRIQLELLHQDALGLADRGPGLESFGEACLPLGRCDGRSGVRSEQLDHDHGVAVEGAEPVGVDVERSVAA